MTEKLYYDDAALLDFSARLVAETALDRGVAVCLDRTAFYPTSGGQPNDVGTLNDFPVLDVWEDELGCVWHLLPHALESELVSGRIDRTRRFDHMQQHTGQHLLSAGFYSLLRANTIGFHLGTEASTIDLDLPELLWETAFRVEREVNAVVWENRPVTIRYVTRDNLDQVPLRKPPKVDGRIRVIWVKDYDASACGGTHVRNTGEVGLVKITGIERYKGGVRVAFLCGNRALIDYQHTFLNLQSAAQTLSVAKSEVPDALQRLQNELAENKKAFEKAQSALLDIEADRLWQNTPEVDGIRYLVAHWNDRSFADVRSMANQLRNQPRTVMFFAVSDAVDTRFVCARTDDLPSIDARNLLTEVLDSLGGRGGGSSLIAQGGSQITSPGVILDTLNKVLPSTAKKNGG